MAGATAETPRDLRRTAAHLQAQVAALTEKIHALLRTSEILEVKLSELHSGETGRLDAQKIANYLGIPLKRLMEGLGLSYKAAHRNPTAEAFQSHLQPIKRILVILEDFFRNPDTVRVWLNTPHPDLEGRCALDLMLAKRADAVLTILENASAGVPI
jgi:hypothetical protein